MNIHTDFSALATIKNPVVTIGTFDGVHGGHLTILRRLQEVAREIKGESVLLTFYPHPRMVLYPDDHNVQLLNTPLEKQQLLEKAGIQHLVIYPFTAEFSRMSPFEYVRDLLYKGLHVHTVVVGYDHRFGRNREGDHETLLELAEIFGFQVEEISPSMIDHVNISSTKIRLALSLGAVEEAARFLGYNYQVSGEVINGEKIGRTIGYPTANIQIDYPYKLIPANGIYAVKVKVGEATYSGVASIGVRPTVAENGTLSIEVYILEFNRDIYGKNISIAFIAYIRPEMKFGSIDELKSHIANDIKLATAYF